MIDCGKDLILYCISCDRLITDASFKVSFGCRSISGTDHGLTLREINNGDGIVCETKYLSKFFVNNNDRSKL